MFGIINTWLYSDTKLTIISQFYSYCRWSKQHSGIHASIKHQNEFFSKKPKKTFVMQFMECINEDVQEKEKFYTSKMPTNTKSLDIRYDHYTFHGRVMKYLMSFVAAKSIHTHYIFKIYISYISTKTYFSLLTIYIFQ